MDLVGSEASCLCGRDTVRQEFHVGNDVTKRANQRGGYADSG